MEKLKAKLLAGSATATTLMLMAAPAFAAEGDAVSPVITAIDSELVGITASAGPLMGKAVALGMVFFGGRILWKNFKSMAK